MKPVPFRFQPKQRSIGSYRWAAVVMLLLLFFPAGNAWAHRVTVFAWIEGENVYVSGKFGGGRQAIDSPVEVFEPGGEKLLEGKTDADGEFVFPLPAAREIKVVLNAGSGHRAEWTITAEELKEATGAPPEIRPAAKEIEEPAAPSPEVVDTQNAPVREMTAPTGMDPEQIEKIIEKALDKKLKPVFRMIAESRDPEKDFRDIVGGIGYLVGLAGMAAYFLSRKNRNSHNDDR
jgi:nickel transport protein